MRFNERNVLGPLEGCGGRQKADRHLGLVGEPFIRTPTPASEGVSPLFQQDSLEELQARQRYRPSTRLLRRVLTGTSCGGAVEGAQGRSKARPEEGGRACRPQFGWLVVASGRGVLWGQAACLQEDVPQSLGGRPPLLCQVSVTAVPMVIIWGQ